MTDSLLVLAAWLALPYGAALVAYLLEHPSDAQNRPSERRTAAL